MPPTTSTITITITIMVLIISVIISNHDRQHDNSLKNDFSLTQGNDTGTQPTDHQHNRLDTTNTMPSGYDQDTANTLYQHGYCRDTTAPPKTP
jgi:hypothetical protein